jgi:hypothetical protein
VYQADIGCCCHCCPAGSWRAQTDSIARCLLLAQLRSSMHHSKLLLVLGASATSLTRYAGFRLFAERLFFKLCLG